MFVLQRLELNKLLLQVADKHGTKYALITISGIDKSGLPVPAHADQSESGKQGKGAGSEQRRVIFLRFKVILCGTRFIIEALFSLSSKGWILPLL